MRNQAFAYLKPHAMGSQAVVAVIGNILEAAKVRVKDMRRIPAAELVEKGYFDLQNGAVARLSLLREPGDFAPFADAFREAFDEPWETVCAENRFFPALQAAGQLNLTPDELLLHWCFAGSTQLADGLYVARFDLAELEQKIHPKDDEDEKEPCSCGHHHDHNHAAHEPQKPLYVVNGFYPAQRRPYADSTGPGVQSFLLDFDCGWDEFNSVVIGDEDPAGALEESIRGYLYDRSDALSFRIDRFDNILYASRSSFEALTDKLLWGAPTRSDPLRKLLAENGSAPLQKLEPALLRLREDEAFCASVHGLDPEQTLALLLAALDKLEKTPVGQA